MLTRTITVLSALTLAGALWGLHMPTAESHATSALTTIKCANLGFSITIPAGWNVTGRCTDDMSATGMYAHNYGVGISIMTSTDWTLSTRNSRDTINSGCNVGTRDSVKSPHISTSLEGGITRTTATCMTKDAQGDRFHVGMLLTQVQGKTYAVFMSIGVAPSATADAMLTKLVTTTLARFTALGHGAVPTVVPFATAPKLIPSKPTATAVATSSESTTSSGTARIICTNLGFSIAVPANWMTAGRCSDEMTASGSYEGRYYGTAIVSVEHNATLAVETANAFIYRACDVGTSENVTPPQVDSTGSGEPITTALCTTKSASGTTFHTGILVTAAGGRVYTLTMVISTATDATVDASLRQLLLTTLREFALLNGEEAATPTVTATPTEAAIMGSTPTAGDSTGTSPSGVRITSFFTVSKQAYDDWASTWKQGKSPTAPLNLVRFTAGTQTVAVYFTYRKAVARSTRYGVEYDDASGLAYCTDPTGPHILTIDTGADMEYCTIPSDFVVGWYTAVLSIDGSRAATTKFSVGQVPGVGTPGATSTPAKAQ